MIANPGSPRAVARSQGAAFDMSAEIEALQRRRVAVEGCDKLLLAEPLALFPALRCIDRRSNVPHGTCRRRLCTVIVDLADRAIPNDSVRFSR